ncbi:hypothetical protein GCM10023347_17640 [Streptomyces chumphonensis]|uniref:Secreted protein n=1 Tax=Streptomyces chumphonensis TaxID=1214925 RepID=A0A927EYD3_9ACTN|nr:DUF6167 family protein [Streptomyces chumphonensis]MBD3931673.1 hypothetical protein [Streptomyces chumphonensis]
MFRRTFWFGAGAAAGVWATTKVNRTLRGLTPESLAARAADKAVDAGHRLRELAVDVRAGMTQRERELNEALGLANDPDAPAPTYLSAAPSPRVLPGSRPQAERGLPRRTIGKEDH